MMATGEGAWQFKTPTGVSPMFMDPGLVMAMLDTELRRHVATAAPHRVFVHGGAVAVAGRGIVIPGASFSGKSRLVAALIRAGAEYYSDEFAVLDQSGLLYPYAKPLSIRGDIPARPERHSAESFGSAAGVEPVPVHLIVVTTYRPGARFAPEPTSAAQGVLALMAHMGVARDRPQEALRAAREAASRAVVLQGERGEADLAAELLIEKVLATTDGANPPGAH